MADGYADDGLDWYRQLIAGGPNDPSGSAGNLPGSGVSGYPQASGSGPYMGYPATQNPFPHPRRRVAAGPAADHHAAILIGLAWYDAVLFVSARSGL
jgi:hypothetical protein